MRLPRFRFSTRWMMVAVALAALGVFSWREYRAWVLRNTFSDPISNSQLNAQLADPQSKHPFVTGKTTPVTITYDFKLSNPKPGVSCLAIGMVWLEDFETKMPVDSFSFDAMLTGGGLEASSGRITWDAVVPRPGKYYLCHRRFHQEDGREITGSYNGGKRLCEFTEEGKP